MSIAPTDRILLAWDKPSFTEADEALLESLAPCLAGVKIGLEAMMQSMPGEGPQPSVADYMRWRLSQNEKLKHLRIMWDGKFLDIGNTVEGAIRGVLAKSVWGYTLHASNSNKALIGAIMTARSGSKILASIGVTVLTHLKTEDCISIFGAEASVKVPEFAERFAKVGGSHIVCSPLELSHLKEGDRQALEPVIPGVRSPWASKDDQARIATPRGAVDNGARFTVIGRQILAAEDPVQAAERTVEEFV